MVCYMKCCDKMAEYGSKREQHKLYYILLSGKMAEKREKSFTSHPDTGKKYVSLLKGEILFKACDDDQPKEKELIKVHPFERPSFSLLCSKIDLGRIDEEEADLLLPLCSLSERLKVYQDPNRLKNGKKMNIGSNVWVTVSVLGVKKELQGVIRYKGPVPGTHGTMFGVELQEAPGKGATNGFFKGKQYFECPKDAGVFVSLERLSLRSKTNKQGTTGDKTEAQSKGSSLDSITSKVKNKFTQGFSSLSSTKSSKDNSVDEHMEHKIEDVVWVFIEDKPQRGIIKYIGRPPGVRDIFAGIQMDNECGLGCGDYYNKQLFTCRKNFAHFTPIGNVISTERFRQMYEEPKDAKIPTFKDGENSKTSSTSEEIVQMESKFSNMSKKDVIKEQEEFLEKFKREAQSQKERETKNNQPKDAVAESESWEMINAGNHADSRLGTAVPVNQNMSRWSETDTNKGIPPPLDDGPDLTKNSANELRNHSGTKSEHAPRGAHSYSMERKKLNLNAQPQSFNDSLSNELEVGSMVEVLSKHSSPKYGVIRWIGFASGVSSKVAGLELEEELDACSDGTFGGKRYFTCPPRRGFFVQLHNCRPDARFSKNSLAPSDARLTEKDFGSYESPIIDDRFIPPPDSIDVYTEKGPHGIQGHHNSCYLDATLFAVFAFSFVMDSVLLRKRRKDDIKQYDKVQHVLRDQIVYPLRDNGFVRADRVLELRKLLDKLGTVTGLVGEEKDPEEFLLTLLHQVLKSEPFLKIKSGAEIRNEYFYQVLADKDVERVLPSVEELLKRSFHQSDLKLAEVPSCLIVQMPRFGKGFKMYKRILPSLTINIGELVEGALQDCAVCGRLATFHCKSCFSVTGFVENDCSGNFCKDCNTRVHSHARRANHKSLPLLIPRSVGAKIGDQPIEHQEMELFAIVCIETSHYVTFVKCQDPQGVTRWCFFDSMADRVGSKNGYNIPCVTECPEVIEWLSSEKHNRERIINTDDKDMPDKVRRILGDAYMCLYQSTEMSMYK